MQADVPVLKTEKIEGQNYQIINALTDIKVADSFVQVNKTGTGSGEARLYIGPKSHQLVRDMFSSLPAKAFFVREELEEYLNAAKDEYFDPSQNYRNKDEMRTEWKKYYALLSDIKSDIIEFEIEEAPGSQDLHRFYIRSVNTVNSDVFYGFVRKIAVPKLSYFDIYKLLDPKQNVVYHLSLNFDRNYLGDNHPFIKKEIAQIKSDRTINAGTKEQIIQARIGQGYFRDALLRDMPSCPITGIDNPILLIASHIKPWKYANNRERVDPKNGLSLTPTYDKLFDLGLISFENDGTLLISRSLSDFEKSRLNLVEGRKYLISPNGREVYLEYHRKHVFIK